MADIQGYYRIFGLQYGASIAEIKTAYRKLVKEYHPDRFPRNSPQHKQAEEQIKNINIAYEALLNYQPQQVDIDRRDIANNSSNISIDIRKTEDRKTNAKTFYNKGVVEVERGNLKEAIEYFSQAIGIDPEYLDAYQYRAFLRDKMGLDRSAEADFQVVWQLRRKSMNYRYPSSATNISSRSPSSRNREKSPNRLNIWQILGGYVKKIIRSVKSIFRR